MCVTRVRTHASGARARRYGRARNANARAGTDARPRREYARTRSANACTYGRACGTCAGEHEQAWMPAAGVCPQGEAQSREAQSREAPSREAPSRVDASSHRDDPAVAPPRANWLSERSRRRGTGPAAPGVDGSRPTRKSRPRRHWNSRCKRSRSTNPAPGARLPQRR
jgi:hypothetical protein